MPPKKIDWSDVTHADHINEKDPLDKWTSCKLCNITIKVKAQFVFQNGNITVTELNIVISIITRIEVVTQN